MMQNQLDRLNLGLSDLRQAIGVPVMPNLNSAPWLTASIAADKSRNCNVYLLHSLCNLFEYQIQETFFIMSTGI